MHETEKQHATKILEITSLNDFANVKAVVRSYHQQCGGLDQIIALNEEDLIVAAELRAELNIPGDHPKDIVRFRDKLIMKQVLAAKDVAVPEFTQASNAAAMVAKFGFPVVIKPLDGASAKGVCIPKNQVELDQALAKIDEAGELDRYECEQHIDGEIFHLDGFMLNNELQFCQVYQYYNSCFDFANGRPVGVMMVDNGHKVLVLTEFAAQVLTVLELTDGPFHLELFIDTQGSVHFLEIGARVGGAFVAQCIEKRWGINLFEQTLAWQTNPEFTGAAFERIKDSGQLYGWLLFPVPSAQGALVKRVEYNLNLPEVVFTILPNEGQNMDQSGGYIHTGGTFLISAPTQAQQLMTIETILVHYRVEFELTTNNGGHSQGD